MKTNITRIFFHIDLYKKCIVKKSQKCFYALLGMKIMIFPHFHKEHLGKCGNTVLGYKKGLKIKINITRIFFHIDLCKKSIVKKSQKWFYTLLGVKMLFFHISSRKMWENTRNTVLGYKKGSNSKSDFVKNS